MKLYRPCAGIVLFNKAHKVFMGKRAQKTSLYGKSGKIGKIGKMKDTRDIGEVGRDTRDIREVGDAWGIDNAGDIGDIYWQFPQGGIDEGEDPLSAAYRELEEETGITHCETFYEHPNWLYYDLPPSLRQSTFGGKYQGQRQKWFGMYFLGGDETIQLPKHQKAEFEAYQWVELEKAPLLAIDFKKDIYHILVDSLSNIIAYDKIK